MSFLRNERKLRILVSPLTLLSMVYKLCNNLVTIPINVVVMYSQLQAEVLSSRNSNISELKIHHLRWARPVYAKLRS